MPAGAAYSHSRRMKLEARRREQAAEVEKWFAVLDHDESGYLEKPELKKLLIHLNPGREPTEEMIEHLIERATAVKVYSIQLEGDKNAGVSRAAVREVVKTYRDYLARQEYIDKVFIKHDTDGSGALEKGEILALLCELVPDAETDQEDVDFILEQCDVDGDSKVSRTELLPMLGVWMVLGADKAADLKEERLKKEQEAQAALAELNSKLLDGALLSAAAQLDTTLLVETAKKKAEIAKAALTGGEANQANQEEANQGQAGEASEGPRYGEEAKQKSQEILLREQKSGSFTGEVVKVGEDGNVLVSEDYTETSLKSAGRSPRAQNSSAAEPELSVTSAIATGTSAASTFGGKRSSSMCALL